MRVDSVSGLQAFVAAAEVRNFRSAGQSLGVSASAIGKAVARLEDQLGVQLFSRTTRSVNLTDAGTLLLRRAKRVLEELDDAAAELAHAHAEPRGRLRLSVPLMGGVLTEPLAGFMAAFPRVELEVEYSDRFTDLVDDGFDAVIRTGEPADSRLMHRKLGAFSWQLVASPEYVARAGRPDTPADLAQHDCLRQRLSTGRLMSWEFGGDDGEHVAARFTANNIEPLLDLALAGAGIAAFPAFLVSRHLADGRLLSVLEGRLERSGVINILWPASRHETPKTRCFVDFVTAWARGRLE